MSEFNAAQVLAEAYTLYKKHHDGMGLDFKIAIAQVQAEAKAEALRDFADAHRMPWIIFRDKDGNPVTVSDLMRETAKNYLDKETRNA